MPTPLKVGISPLCMKRMFRLFKHVVIRRLKYQLNTDSFGNLFTLEIYKKVTKLVTT